MCWDLISERPQEENLLKIRGARQEVRLLHRHHGPEQEAEVHRRSLGENLILLHNKSDPLRPYTVMNCALIQLFGTSFLLEECFFFPS